MNLRRRLGRLAKTAAHVALAFAPSAVKVPVYRTVFGFRIAKGAKIGISILDVDQFDMGEGASIGHGNLLTRTQKVHIGAGAEIGYGNVLRGGAEIQLQPYSTVFRFNILNSIPDNDCSTDTDPRLLLGEGAYVVSGHRLDFTDRISLGKNVVLAGRGSSLWTHQAQSSAPIDIGEFSYLGSEVRVAPGAALGPMSILGMGSVLASNWDGHAVFGGVPAKPIRPITPQDEKQLRRKTKKSIPEDLY